MPVISGNLKDKIEVYAEQETPNDSNEFVKSYTYSFSDRAKILFVSGSEKMAGQMSYADKVIKVEVRFKWDVYNERQIIKWRGDYYNIRSIDEDIDRRFISLTADRAPTGSLTINE